MKEHINFICKTVFLESNVLELFATTSLMTPPKLLLFSLYFHALTIANLSWLVSLSPWSANFRESKTVKPVLQSVHFHMFTSLQYSDIFTGCLSEPEFYIRLHASVSTPSSPPLLLISLTFCICTLLLDLFPPATTPDSSKIHSVKARRKVIVLSLTLVRLSGTHCHCTLEMLQLSTPLSLLQKPISSASKNLISSSA